MNKQVFHKILIANRGEIASRIIRSVQETGRSAVAVYASPDRDLPFVAEADEAFPLGEGSLAETYLNADRIIAAARMSGADAIHPGYGFLSENADFADSCRAAGISFIGPSAEAISLMGNKVKARDIAEKAGIPVLKGITGTLETLLDRSKELVFPVLVKPSDGGGGKGMRLVKEPQELAPALQAAAREALSYFGSEEVFIEHYLEAPRHIEVQVLADHHGNAIHLFERECTLQRRYQKIVEEAPSPAVDEDLRKQITDYALTLVKSIGYTSAGTVEFLMSRDKKIYFLEMNTRIQVEHPVTEAITGVDLVREQIRIAQNLPLSFRQEDLKINCHAIEVRLYSEEPEKEFRPSSGLLTSAVYPEKPWIRNDYGYREGNRVNPWYDPLIAKIIVTGRNRDEARNRLTGALKETHISGVQTNRDFLTELTDSAAFRGNEVDTRWIDDNLMEIIGLTEKRKAEQETAELLGAAVLVALQHNYNPEKDTIWHSAGYWRIFPEILMNYGERQYRLHYEMTGNRKKIQLHFEGRILDISLEQQTGKHFRISYGTHQLALWGSVDRSDISLDINGIRYDFRRPDIPDPRYISTDSASSAENRNEVLAPLPGRIAEVLVREGQEVEPGETMLIIESMKMENRIVSSRHGRVGNVYVKKGDQAEKNKLLILLV